MKKKLHTSKVTTICTLLEEGGFQLLLLMLTLVALNSLSLSLSSSAKLTTKTAAGCCLEEMRFSWTIHQSSGAETSWGDEEGEEEVGRDASRDYETLSNACSSCLGLVSLFLAASFRWTKR